MVEVAALFLLNELQYQKTIFFLSLKKANNLKER